MGQSSSVGSNIMRALLLFASVATIAAKNKTILIAGDSWGTVFATGTVVDGGFFEYVLKKHGCAYKHARNIAVAGSTAAQVNSYNRIHVFVCYSMQAWRLFARILPALSTMLCCV